MGACPPAFPCAPARAGGNSHGRNTHTCGFALFAGIEGAEISAMLRCLSPAAALSRGGTICAPANWRWRWRWCWRAACAWSAWTPGASAASSSALARARLCRGLCLRGGRTAACDVGGGGRIAMLFLDAARVLTPAPRLRLPRPPRAQSAHGDGEERTCCSRASIRLITPHTIRERLLPISPARRCGAARARSSSPSTASSWPTIWPWSAAPFRRNSPKCAAMASSSASAAASLC